MRAQGSRQRQNGGRESGRRKNSLALFPMWRSRRTTGPAANAIQARQREQVNVNQQIYPFSTRGALARCLGALWADTRNDWRSVFERALLRVTAGRWRSAVLRKPRTPERLSR